jgi:signal transduction histidine kinase
MRARAEELRGELVAVRQERGTLVQARLPVVSR